MTTMADVARHAGVSVMTVSNVVNDHPHVRAETRARVLASIAALGYRVNTTARSLRQGRTGVIGLAVPEIDRPYFGMLAAQCVERAAERGYGLVIEQTGSRREAELDAILHSRLRSYDGLLLHASHLVDEDAALLRGDHPVVVLGERAYRAPIDHVLMANEAGGALAARHLIDIGCRRIAMLGGRVASADDIDVATSRTRGFLTALADAGRPADPGLVWPTPYTLQDAHRAMQQLCREVPGVDGVFCATDLVAFGALRAAADLGLQVPRDVAIIGFDDVPEAAYRTPSLTSVAPDHAAMVDAALDLLVRRIAGERDAEDYREVIGPVALVARESTARKPS